MRANSSEPDHILIAAISGRALAQAACNAGYAPLVVDFFDDLDTRERAADNRLIGGDLARGFEAGPLIEALRALSHNRRPVGLAYGAGFEDRTELLGLLGQHWPLLGNAAAVVAQVKDPRILAKLCTDLGIDHPEICFDVPSRPEEWLIKQAGGSGGSHIAAASTLSLAPGDYYQRRVEGRPVSALVLANGQQALVLGLSEQWVTPTRHQPWRFGGAARPAGLSVELAEGLRHAARRMAEATHLVGLNSIDFLVRETDFCLIEINPRPGATLDIFHDSDGRLLRAHVEACRGHLSDEPLRFAEAEAACVAYAPAAISSVPAWDWPDWTADRQKPFSAIAENDPYCTVMARAPDLASARDRLDHRAAQISRRLAHLALAWSPKKDVAA